MRALWLVNQLWVIVPLYNNQINARALIGQSAVGYCAGKPTENRASSKLLYKSNRPQVFHGLQADKLLGMLVEHSKSS